MKVTYVENNTKLIVESNEVSEVLQVLPCGCKFTYHKHVK